MTLEMMAKLDAYAQAYMAFERAWEIKDEALIETTIDRKLDLWDELVELFTDHDALIHLTRGFIAYHMTKSEAA